MKILLHVFLFCLVHFEGLAQSTQLIRVTDAVTKAPIRHCLVSLKSTQESFLTNDEGLVRVAYLTDSDTLLVHYPGYEYVRVPVKSALLSEEILLFRMPELQVPAKANPNEKIVLDKINKCRQYLRKAKSSFSKAYVDLTGFEDDIPNEILRFYYNAETNGTQLRSLEMKAGGFALTPIEDKQFQNFFTLYAFANINLLNTFDYFPITPFSDFSEKPTRLFIFKRNASFPDPDVMHITFEPFIDNGKVCSGEIWIDKNDKPLKIRIFARNVSNYPLKSGVPSESISEVDFDISYIFAPNLPNIRLQLIDFECSFSKTSGNNTDHNVSKRIKSSAVMHFFDFNQQFIIPNIVYLLPTLYYDYQKAILIPYDSLFWARTNAKEWTSDQLAIIKNFKENGTVINLGAQQIRTGYEDNSKLWELTANIEEKPLFVWRHNIKYVPKNREKSKYKPNCCIPDYFYLDVNQYHDTISISNQLFFIEANKAYYPDGSNQSYAWLSIYMDILELRRQEILQELVKLKSSEAIIEQFYKKIKLVAKSMQNIQKETKNGTNLQALTRWNDYLIREIGKDNFNIYGVLY